VGKGMEGKTRREEDGRGFSGREGGMGVGKGAGA